MALVALLWAVPMVSARQKEVHARWDELTPLVEKREIETVLANGVQVRGRAEKVLPDALEVRVKKTSDAAVIPKGRTRIPREQFAVLTVRWKRSSLRYVLAPAMGWGVAILFARLGVIREHDPPFFGYGVLTLFGIAGYLVGEWLDSRQMRLVLVPQRPVEAPVKGEESSEGGEFEGGTSCTK